jgi:DNA mismatch endonuclease (patch repair protein)
MNCRKAPRFSSFSPASASSSFAKRHNKAKDTAPEMLLRKALWSRGVRYRLHVSHLLGKPDIVFLKERVLVFIDGDFWHGRNWDELEKKLRHRANAEYWIAKIQYNITRDHEQTLALEQQGWTVVRIWETEVIKSIEETVGKIMIALKSGVYGFSN